MYQLMTTSVNSGFYVSCRDTESRWCVVW